MSTAPTPAQGVQKLTPELKAFIAEWKEKPGNLIMILHRLQQHFGFVPREVAFEVADLIDVPLAKIYGVITFYNFFKLKKPGRNQIQVCMGTACYVRGGKEVLDAFKKKLEIDVGETTPDRMFSLEVGRCFGACGMAPVVMVNDTVHQRVKPARVGELVSRLAADAAAAAGKEQA